MSDESADQGPALGTDPFRNTDGTLSYLIRLRERSVRASAELGAPVVEGKTAPAAPAEPLDLGPEIPGLRGLEERDEPKTLADRAAGVVLDDADEDRIARVSAELEDRPQDALGFSPRTARRALAAFKILYRYWFRVSSAGHANLPEKGPVILAANHGGVLPFDAIMAVVDVMLRADPPRLVRTIVDRWVGSLPFVNIFYSQVGQVIGTRENFRQLLRSDQLVLVFPEGTAGIRKRAAERYVLQEFNVGFVEESVRHRVPIVPTAIIGADDQAPILYDIKPLARLLGLPVFPITPTFPLLGPLGLVPYPVKYEIRYGEPFRFYEDFRADDASDPHAIQYMAEQVRRRLQEMTDARVLERRGRSE